jgi:hypothetical protein
MAEAYRQRRGVSLRRPAAEGEAHAHRMDNERMPPIGEDHILGEFRDVAETVTELNIRSRRRTLGCVNDAGVVDQLVPSRCAVKRIQSALNRSKNCCQTPAATLDATAEVSHEIVRCRSHRSSTWPWRRDNGPW